LVIAAFSALQDSFAANRPSLARVRAGLARRHFVASQSRRPYRRGIVGLSYAIGGQKYFATLLFTVASCIGPRTVSNRTRSSRFLRLPYAASLPALPFWGLCHYDARARVENSSQPGTSAWSLPYAGWWRANTSPTFPHPCTVRHGC